jgi:hypothetical protein
VAGYGCSLMKQVMLWLTKKLSLKT